MKLIAIFCAFLSSVAPVVAVNCDAGFLRSGEDCVACSPGKYQFSVDLCEDCAIGTYSPHGAAECTDCATGRYAPKKGTKSCKYCEAGKFSDFTKQTKPCVEETPPGWYSYPGASRKEACGPGTYQPESGASECLYCRTSKSHTATECQQYAYIFAHSALIAFVVLGSVGIATCFRRMCSTYDVHFCVGGKLMGKLKSNSKDAGAA